MNSPLPDELLQYPYHITLPVQWGDQDAFGHVNNVVYFRWMESARIAYFQWAGLGSMSNQGIGPILASIKCDYRRQLTYPDTLIIAASIASIGRTSIKMTHRIYSQTQKAVAAEGDSVIVMFDYEAQRPVAVPDEMRVKIAGLEKWPAPGPSPL
jgi:acyl-CoA thioester hydrolase